MKGIPGRSVCTVQGCGNFVKGHGYCQGHYLQVKTHGKVVREQIGVFEKKICSVVGCGEPFKARGLCSRHTYQFYKYGKVISAEKMKNPNRKCSIPGCGKRHAGRGYCTGHLGQVVKHGCIVSNSLAPRNGISTTGDGYITLKRPGHPTANKRGYVKRCNIVWEEMTGQVVISPAMIHHKNGIKKDDSFDNLQYFSCDAEHQSAKHRMSGYFGVVLGGVIL